ncbi:MULTISPECIES: ketopantoate reductase family protein [unclassified Nocardiopsis]|uniref:ketopantoate reductase family protein n=1 Tax=unclassified Nocardiopsis TaxID=2649073 RepID=UPI00191533DC|nr:MULTISPECIES: ketopantoate reductase family protein [unclassified Nocardiopsis]
MRILIVGAGAVGGYFGAHLARAGRNVDFLVRPARAELLRERGLVLRDVEGRTETVPVSAVTADQLRADYDLVIVAVKSYGFEAAVKDLSSAVGPRTVVLPFLNGMRHVDTLVERFGADRVYGGVAMVMTRLGEQGEIVEVGKLGQLVYGPLTEQPVLPLADVHAALDSGGHTATPSEDIRQELWNKWVFLATLGACTCLMRGPIGRVNSAPGGQEFTAAVFEEAIAVAAASGFPPDQATRERADAVIANTTASTTTSMYWDLTHGNPVEAEHIIGDLVARGRELGVPTPLFSLAYTHLCVYEASRE